MNILSHDGAFLHFFKSQTGQGEGDFEETFLGETTLDVALGEVNVVQGLGQVEFSVEGAHNVVLG